MLFNLENNTLHFNDKHLSKNTVMGTKVAPTYANLVLDKKTNCTPTLLINTVKNIGMIGNSIWIIASYFGKHKLAI